MKIGPVEKGIAVEKKGNYELMWGGLDVGDSRLVSCDDTAERIQLCNKVRSYLYHLRDKGALEGRWFSIKYEGETGFRIWRTQ